MRLDHLLSKEIQIKRSLIWAIKRLNEVQTAVAELFEE